MQEYLNIAIEAGKTLRKELSDDILAAYAKYIKDKYKAEPGFITMNLPMLLDVLEKGGIENPLICCSINKIGFRMSGGIKIYEKTLKERKF